MNTVTKPQPESSISHSTGGSMYAGPDAVATFRAYVIASALDLYAKTGIKANRAYTPTAMLRVAKEITGKTFKRGQYAEAAAAIREWASLMRSGIPETSTRPEDQP